MDIDMDALEKALAGKSRRSRKEPAIKPGLSNQELLEEAKRLGKKTEEVYGKTLRTRRDRKSYYIRNNNLWCRGLPVRDIDTVPRIVLERLVVNGKEKLKEYRATVDKLVKDPPTLALEVNLEGKTNEDVIRYAEEKAESELTQLILGRISAPGVHKLYLSFRVPLETCSVIIAGWMPNKFHVSGVSFTPKGAAEAAQLMEFINRLDHVKEEVNKQIDSIGIERR